MPEGARIATDAEAGSRGLTRRSLLERGGAFSVAVIAAWGWPEFLAAAEAATPGLTAAREATLRALIAAAAEAPGTLVKTDRADEAVAAVRRWYAGLADDERRGVERVLDLIEAGPSDRALSQKTARAAREYLKVLAGARSKEERAFEAGVKDVRTGEPSSSGVAFRAFLDSRALELRDRAQAIRRDYGPEALELDPETGLTRYQPPINGEVPQRDWPEELSIPEGRQRFLASAAVSLAALAFYPPRADVPL